MNFGLLMPFQNPARWARPFPDLYREHIEHIVRAEELGYDTVWLTEHHFDPDGWSPSLLPLAAGIATRTRRIRVGTFILILPFQHALRVAEDAATVDILSNGRLDLGVGKGYRVNEFRGFGIPREQREARLEEDLEVLRRAWTEDRFSFDGQFYHLTDVSLSPRPVQRPHPPLWIGARGRRAIERTARLGCHLMGTGEVEQQRAYDRALAQHGRKPEDFFIAQLRWVYVAENREKAWDDVEAHLHYLFTSAFPLLKEAGDLRADRTMREPPGPKDLRKIDPTIPGGAPIVGSPEDCVRAIERYRRETRITHLAMGMHLPGLAPGKVLRSLELFAREVMPRFR
ncbi:MAG: LLM class flavin-dependent oxidoreductase [Thermodesulfobacteriota bacterium]|jgi:alkanesulfonate monooxygenase SsuD/methylene tetrahydromethanopterin reductase-like flavin-dependent oxidoreductase (luciferase family)